MATIFPFIPFKKPEPEEIDPHMNVEEKWVAIHTYYLRAGRLAFGLRYRFVRPSDEEIVGLYAKMKRLGSELSKFYDEHPELLFRYEKSLGKIEELVEVKGELPC